MNFEIRTDIYPGSVIPKSAAGNVDGETFLNQIFFLTDGVMLSQIKEISGIDGSTLQNWVKRGWIGNTVNKKYSKNQLARILIINMLRDTMHLEEIDYLLKYINGTINWEEDDIIPEARLYDYICRIIDSSSGEGISNAQRLHEYISESVSDYSEKIPGARARLENALGVIIVAYFASLAKDKTRRLFLELRKRAEKEDAEEARQIYGMVMPQRVKKGSNPTDISEDE